MIRSWISTHRWTLIFSIVAFFFAIPLLLYVSNPVLHAAGLHEMASAGDNMRAADDGQEAAMESTAAAAAAAAAAASSSSGNEDGRGKDTDDPLDGVTLTPPEKSTMDSIKDYLKDAADVLKEDWESTKEAASKTFDSSDEATEVSPQTPLDSETSRPPTYDTDELGSDSGASKGSGSRDTSGNASGGDSKSDSSDSSSGESSGKTSGSPGDKASDWFGEGAGDYLDILTGKW